MHCYNPVTPVCALLRTGVETDLRKILTLIIVVAVYLNGVAQDSLVHLRCSLL